MANFCRNCGKELQDGVQFCGGCGTAVSTVASQPDSLTSQNDSSFNQPGSFANQSGTVVNQTVVNNYNQSRPTIQKRGIALAVVLSLITCGIYGIFWFISMTDESNMLSDEKTASGGMAFLYSLITCGIYGVYWNYKMGKKMANAGSKYGKSISDNSVLYLILCLLGFGIVNYCLIQNDLNSFAE